MILRPYVSADLEELLTLFYETVHTVNARDYTPAQLDAWAGPHTDRERWDRTLREHTSLVAEENGQIIAAMSLIIRRVFAGFSLMYAPRAPICDLHDTALVQRLQIGRAHV